ncbi:MAG: MBL fold metallo-hydrolase, partial [Firmicutes bacterium]|nr:MBL fold metallo-hydrolase [Bacillota bacterium]
RPLKLTDEVIARLEQSLPPDVPEAQRRAFLDTLRNPPKAPVDRVIRPGEELPFCGGLVVIGTPGHTPGHISLYHRPSRTLIAADALRVVDGQLVGPSEEMTLDMARARASLKAFTAFDVATVICYHGGAYADEPNRRLAELAG